jgi:hypothetical protein
MNQVELLDLITRFSKRPLPAVIKRHIYLWLGESDDLVSKIPTGISKKISIHNLCQTLTNFPNGDKAANRELTKVLENWIASEFPPSQQQKILVVTGLDLFYRYRIPMSLFMRLANESCMVVIVLSALDVNFIPQKPLPKYLQLNPNAIFQYISSEIPEEAIVKEE